MRPPLNAGENEQRLVRLPPLVVASMRPPLNAGENGAAPRSPAAACCRFNEAPAERGGEREAIAVVVHGGDCFNEAPAERGGERIADHLPDEVADASMRPPLNAGENDGGRWNSVAVT